MKFSFVETIPSHIYEVLLDASDITRDEIAQTQPNLWLFMRDTIGLVDRSKTVTLCRGTEPIFVFGHTGGISSGTRLTWFIAKQGYFDLGARGVLLARRYLGVVKVAWPKTCLESYSYSLHPDCERWFSLLGFKQVHPSTAMRCRVFRLDTSPSAALPKPKVDLSIGV